MGHLKEFGGEGIYRGWGIGVTATIPLFDRNQGNRMKARAGVTKSSQELRAGIIELRAEVEEADQLFRTAYQKASALADEEVRLAVKVRESMIEAYKAGGHTLIDVLDAERSYREIYCLYISSRADYWRAMYLYNSVIGSGSYNR
jgi:cobalt-zinc-cadmium efflux system outer membrane protein